MNSIKLIRLTKALDAINKLGVGQEGGGEAPHNSTEAFGQVKPIKVKGDSKYLPKVIDSEEGHKPNPIVLKVDVETNNVGFGTTDNVPKKEKKYLAVNIADSEKGMRKKITAQGSLSKEAPGESKPYSDFNTPSDDSFYLPFDVKDEAAEEEDELKEEKVQQNGRGVKKQPFNTGQVEMATIGNQSGQG